MLSTKRIAAVAALAFTLALSGCASGDELIPRIEIAGSRAFIYQSLDELALDSNAIVVATPTGEEYSIPLPEGYGESTTRISFVKMKVDKLVSGKVTSDTIDVVSPGIDENTGRQALAEGGPFLIFLAPAMWNANEPIGGYVATGGPAGVFAGSKSSPDAFARIDDESSALPISIDLGSRARTALPTITKSEETLLNEGP